MASAQAAPAAPLAVHNTSLPNALLREEYHAQFQAEGGTLPYKWSVTDGTMPPGLNLSDAGIFSGMPSKLGDFAFIVTVTDSSNPANQKSQPVLFHVIAALVVDWKTPPKVSGGRIDGTIKVSNQDDHDFDLTAIIVAVNEIGRATAIGYQHFTLNKGTTEFEIPFGEHLPAGTYTLNVDVVAEVPETNAIHRARLAAPSLQIVATP